MADFFFEVIKALYYFCGQNLGLAIILLGILTRVVFYPLTRQQINNSAKIKELQPLIDKLKTKYKNNNQKFQEEQLKLFKEHKINPAGGCLPVLVQIVVFSMLYQAFYRFLASKTFNMNFLFWQMNKPDVFQISFDSKTVIPIPGLLVIFAATTQFLQSKLMIPKSTPPVHREDTKKEVEEKVDFMTEMGNAQSQMIYMFPLMFLFLGTRWPSGLALYWTVSTGIAIIEQILTRKNILKKA